jgi:hypothetical protein
MGKVWVLFVPMAEMIAGCTVLQKASDTTPAEALMSPAVSAVALHRNPAGVFFYGSFAGSQYDAARGGEGQPVAQAEVAAKFSGNWAGSFLVGCDGVGSPLAQAGAGVGWERIAAGAEMAVGCGDAQAAAGVVWRAFDRSKFVLDAGVLAGNNTWAPIYTVLAAGKLDRQTIVVVGLALSSDFGGFSFRTPDIELLGGADYLGWLNVAVGIGAKNCQAVFSSSVFLGKKLKFGIGYEMRSDGEKTRGAFRLGVRCKLDRPLFKKSRPNAGLPRSALAR